MKNTKIHFTIALIIINVFIIIAAGFMQPLWLLFANQIHGDVQTAGAAIAVFSIVIGVLTCVFAKLEDYWNKDGLVLVLSQLMFVIGYAGYYFVATPMQLYAVQAFLGLAGAIQVPALFSLYHRFIPKDRGRVYWGIWNGFYNIAIGIGALASSFIASHYGLHAVFSSLLVVVCIAFVLTILVAFKISD